MKVYIATALERAEEAKALASQLALLGHEIAYAWWEHGSVQAEGPERITEVAGLETDAVRAADLFVALLPGGRGTHTEIGLALSESLGRDETRMKKRIILVGPLEGADGRTCAFYLHPHVDRRFASVEEALAFLTGIRVAMLDGWQF